MAKKKTKQAEVEIFNEKKMDETYSFGEITVPEKWEDVKLGMYTAYLTKAAEKEELYKEDFNKAKKEKSQEPDKEDAKYNMTDRDLLAAFTDFDTDKIDLLPIELYNSIMAKMSFLVTNPLDNVKPKKDIKYNGVHLCINDMETMKVKEYSDVEAVLAANPYDYPSLLAILCRECKGVKTDHVTGFTYLINEPYDEEFANVVFDSRRKMFEEMPVTDVLPLLGFFLLKGLASSNHFRESLRTAALGARDIVESLLSSQESGAFKRPFSIVQTIKLKKYRKSIDSILSTT